LLVFQLGRSGADGKFGLLTENAVKQFQRQHSLPDTGIVGPNTWNRLAELHPDILTATSDEEEIIEVGDITAPSITEIRDRVSAIYDQTETILESWQTAYENFGRVLQEDPEDSTRPDFGGVFTSVVSDLLVGQVLSLLPAGVGTATKTFIELMGKLSQELERARAAGLRLRISRWIRDSIGLMADTQNKIPDTKLQSMKEVSAYYENSPEPEKLRVSKDIDKALEALRHNNHNQNYLFLTIAWEFIRSFNGSVKLYIQAAFWNRGNPISWLDTRDWKVNKATLNEDIPRGQQIAQEMKRLYPEGINFDSWNIRRLFNFNIGGRVEPGWSTPGLPDVEYIVEYYENGGSHAPTGLPPDLPWQGWLERLKEGLPPTSNIVGLRN
jgi:hypothetical protein